MIEQLLGEHPWMLLPLAAIFGVTYLIKALYALHGSFSQRRKEFLEIWSAEPSTLRSSGRMSFAASKSTCLNSAATLRLPLKTGVLNPC